MTKLLWLPAAIVDPHPRSFPWADTTNPKGCLHTTEGNGRPTYDGWTIMPHATVMPIPGRGVTVYQHLPFSQASFALRHTELQPTNGDYIFQFELVGTCDPNGPRGAYYWPNADDAVLLDLYLKVIKPLDQAFIIPFRALEFLRFPSQAGQNRLSNAQFDAYSGWLGHQHVPQNDHGDPGAFPWARLAKLAQDHDAQEDNPMAGITLDDIGKLIDARLAAHDQTLVSKVVGQDLGKAGGSDTVGICLQSGLQNSRVALDRLDALEKTVQEILTKVSAPVATWTGKEEQPGE